MMVELGDVSKITNLIESRTRRGIAAVHVGGSLSDEYMGRPSILVARYT